MPGPFDEIAQALLDFREGALDPRALGDFLGPGISGIEVTQGIQYYQASAHLTDPADRQPDNAVVLVAGKPAWVRVYVHSGWFGGEIAGATGTLELRRRELGIFYVPIATLNPQPPGSVTAARGRAYADERGVLTNSLNFIVPADTMCGHLKFIVTVNFGSTTRTREVALDVTLRQTLRLRGVMVGYNGPTSTAAGAPNLTLAAPTTTALQTTSQWALLAFPVESTATYSSAGSITLTVPLSDPPSCAGCCTPNWGTLNAMVAAQVTADGNKPDVLYYGLIASGVPMGPIIGCESSGVSAGGVGNGVTLAHELGHHCGFPHAPCGSVGTPDATYPAYEPYDPAGTPTASTGEYGLDISNGNIMSPSLFKDMMSYCGPKWISLHNYGRLVQNDKLDPRRSCVDYPWWRDYVIYQREFPPGKWLPDPPPDPFVRDVDPEPWISIIGVMRSERELEVTSFMRVVTRASAFGTRSTELTAELVGEKGEQLAQGSLRELRSQAACGCGSDDGDQAGFPRVVQALIPDVARGASLTIRRDDQVLWSVHAPATLPKVGELVATPDGDKLKVSWRVETENDRPELWLQWSGDRGKTWNALATGLDGREAELDAAHLPAGAVSVRLLAGDGFHTAASKAVRVTLPKRSPAVGILTPREGQVIVAGGPMRLWAAVTYSGAEHGEAAVEARWLLDGKAVADSLDAFIVAPPEGEHRLQLEIAARDQRAEAMTSFQTVEVMGHEPRNDG